MAKKVFWEGKSNNQLKMTETWDNEYSCKIKGKKAIVSIHRMVPLKSICIASEDECELYGLLFKVLRFENLYDGCFYKTTKLEIDGQDVIGITDNWLPFFNSKICWNMLPNLSKDKDYAVTFIKWLELSESLGIIHQMFLYASYAEDLTPDVKLALILQTFEPLSHDMENEGMLTVQPHNHRNSQDKRINFQDRLFAVMSKYKEILFSKDNIDVVAERAANLRNRIIHLDRGRTDVLSGRESGFYIQKFVSLYTIIVFDMLSMDASLYEGQMKDTICRYEKEFPNIIIE